MQKETRAETRAADDTREVEALLGPYRGNRLTMTAADAQNAINDHWAYDPYDAHEEHDPLTDDERTHALEAAVAWRDAQLAAAAGETPPDPPPESGGESRAMKPEHERGGYKTRHR